MPVYRKGNAWRVVVYVEGLRRDAIVRCSREEADSIEAALRSEIIEQSDMPGWRKKATSSRPSPLDDTYIYFVQAGEGGPIKIGRATDLESRLAGIQTHNHEEIKLLVAAVGDRLSEREVHDLFNHLKIRGEWFRPEADLLAFIEDVKKRP